MRRFIQLELMLKAVRAYEPLSMARQANNRPQARRRLEATKRVVTLPNGKGDKSPLRHTGKIHAYVICFTGQGLSNDIKGTG